MFKSLKRLFGGESEASASSKNAARAASQEALEAAEEENANDSPRPLTGAPRPELADLPFDPDAIRLEALFAQAAHEARKRDEFMHALLEANLIVLGQAEAGESGMQNVQLATQVVSDEPVALVFTSFQALVSAGGSMEQPHIRMRTADLLQMIRSQLGFVLNPGNRLGKVFTRAEVLQILGIDSDAQENAADTEAGDDMQITVGQPKEYPAGMRESLASVIGATPMIRSIHTGMMSAGNQPPVFLAVVSTDKTLEREEFMNLINEMGSQIGPSLKGQSINFAPMDPAFQDLVDRGALLDVTISLQ